MFHVNDHLFFGRMTNGGVRILKYSSAPLTIPDADQPRDKPGELVPELDARIDGGIWASIIASVSAQGEVAGRFYVAEAFHRGEQIR